VRRRSALAYGWEGDERAALIALLTAPQIRLSSGLILTIHWIHYLVGSPQQKSSESHEKLRAYALKTDGAVEDASPQIGNVEIESVILSSAVAALATPVRQRATNPWHENTAIHATIAMIFDRSWTAPEEN
jgi:hypothetical protein